MNDEIIKEFKKVWKALKSKQDKKSAPAKKVDNSKETETPEK